MKVSRFVDIKCRINCFAFSKLVSLKSQIGFENALICIQLKFLCASEFKWRGKSSPRSEDEQRIFIKEFNISFPFIVNFKLIKRDSKWKYQVVVKYLFGNLIFARMGRNPLDAFFPEGAAEECWYTAQDLRAENMGNIFLIKSKDFSVSMSNHCCYLWQKEAVWVERRGRQLSQACKAKDEIRKLKHQPFRCSQKQTRERVRLKLTNFWWDELENFIIRA